MENDAIIKAVDSLLKRVNELEQLLKNKENTSIQVQVDIQEFNLQELSLEELAFHLDKLDIKELSGMLNLGNTFSPKILGKNKSISSVKKRKKTEDKKSTNEDIQIHINGKSIPYTLHNRKDDEVD